MKLIAKRVGKAHELVALIPSARRRGLFWAWLTTRRNFTLASPERTALASGTTPTTEATCSSALPNPTSAD